MLIMVFDGPTSHGDPVVSALALREQRSKTGLDELDPPMEGKTMSTLIPVTRHFSVFLLQPPASCRLQVSPANLPRAARSNASPSSGRPPSS
ncbi:hypothetical protein [Pseudomonas agarici]|uniref:hypothetical protein n=1 Tax=Pseudomonas agarici TaxID=46677 RepID=UPI0008CD3EF1|nr:hypothetical protein [Pseudomonas agarici]NWB93192.1 hypothetical protein [Pseudomonas agarici]NWC08437.1 hypothetical protein [Pseudomonas agarici]SEK66813.1 hypothetical protein SAMN05216604_105113 [Pseudomonas agarici]